VVNVDDFHRLNNTWGHDKGDELIQVIAHELRFLLPDGCLLSRTVGAEFGVIAEVAADADRLLQIGREILERFRSPIRFGPTDDLYLSVSIGAACFPEHGSDVDQLLQNVHTAVRAAKDAGGQTVCLYEPRMRRAMQDQHWLDQNLRCALERRQFTLHFQPKVPLNGGPIVAVEALIRWRHPERGDIAPNEFIPRAERTGLIVPIGRWVVATAAQQAAHWLAQGIDLRVALNISARQLVDLELPALLAQSQITADGRLDIELTESSFIEDETRAIEFIEACRAIGMRVYLDDFGTGYSSLAQLARLPLNGVKLDQSFISLQPQTEKNRTLIRALTTVALQFGLKVVGEGGETREQAEFLRACGVSCGQGWLYARAMPPDELEAWAAAHAARVGTREAGHACG